jgi:hypothetical protein
MITTLITGVNNPNRSESWSVYSSRYMSLSRTRSWSLFLTRSRSWSRDMVLYGDGARSFSK